MEVKERIVDLRQYFLYLWDNIFIIILVTTLFCGAFSGYNILKQKKEIEASVSSSSGENAKDATIKSLIEQTLVAGEEDSDVVGPFADQPLGSYMVSKVLYIDYDYSMLGDGTNQDYEYIISKIQSDINAVLNSDGATQEVIERSKLSDYEDTKDLNVDTFRYLRSCYFSGLHTYRVAVLDVDEKRAVDVLNSIIEVYKEEAYKIEAVKDIYVLDDSQVIRTSTGKTGAKMVAASPKTFSKKSLLKYAVVGAMGGMVLIVGLYLLLFIVLDSVRNAIDLNYAEISLLGVIPKRKNSKNEALRRTAINLSYLKDFQKIMIVPVDKNSEDDAILESIKTAIKEIKGCNIIIEGTKNIKESADASADATKYDGVIILSKYGKTRMKDLIFAVGEINKTGVKILGSLITDARHM